MTIKPNVKAGGGWGSINHNQSGMAVKSTVQAGGVTYNHNQSAK